jgi:hypothetical protein
MLALASPEQKAELKRLLERDARTDALGIETWRAAFQHGGESNNRGSA